MKTWTRIAQANLDHYNSHPTQHNIITVAYGVAALVVARKVAKRLARQDDPILRSGMMA